jgi:tetratricopeptide (TPR) repeat protein
LSFFVTQVPALTTNGKRRSRAKHTQWYFQKATIGLLSLAHRRRRSQILIAGFTKAQVLHACRDVLRQLDSPSALRGNILLEASPLADLPHGVLRDRLQVIVENTLKLLTDRQALIIRRCDVCGERFSLVATDLGISIRQLFRDRGDALAEITAEIVRANPKAPARVVTRSPLDTLVRSAEALVQCGNWRSASDMLESAVGALADPFDRMRIVLILAELYLEAGRLTLATQHIDAAEHATNISEDHWQYHYAQAVRARLSHRLSNAEAADVLSRTAVRYLRQLTHVSPEKATVEALARSLLIQAEIDLALGRTANATDVTSEAVHVVASVDPTDAFLSLTVRTTAALCRLFSWADAEAGHDELKRCKAEAMERGYLREATFISTYLSTYYRTCRQLDRSLETVIDAMPAARAANFDEPLGGLLTEQGWTLLLLGRHSEALDVLIEARTHFCSNRELEAVTDVLSARAWAGSGRPDLALATAEAAEATFVLMGRRRLAGMSLMVQAEALHRLARWDAASRTGQAAFETLRSALGEKSPIVERARKAITALGEPPRSRARTL